MIYWRLLFYSAILLTAALYSCTVSTVLFIYSRVYVYEVYALLVSIRNTPVMEMIKLKTVRTRNTFCGTLLSLQLAKFWEKLLPMQKLTEINQTSHQLSWICYNVITQYHAIHFHGPNTVLYIYWFCSLRNVQYHISACQQYTNGLRQFVGCVCGV